MAVTNGLLAKSCDGIEDRIICRTHTTISLFDISMVYLTLIDTTFSCEVIGLPVLTFLINRRTSQQVRIPLSSNLTVWFFAFSSSEI